MGALNGFIGLLLGGFPIVHFALIFRHGLIDEGERGGGGTDAHAQIIVLEVASRPSNSLMAGKR